MSLKRSTDDRVIARNQRDTRRWCGGIVGREHAYDLADAYARDACGMEQRWWLRQFPSHQDYRPDKDGELEYIRRWRRYWIISCEQCGRRGFFYRARYLRGDYDHMTVTRD